MQSKILPLPELGQQIEQIKLTNGQQTSKIIATYAGMLDKNTLKFIINDHESLNISLNMWKDYTYWVIDNHSETVLQVYNRILN